MLPLIHVIEQDSAVRRSLCFLLSNSDYDVQSSTSIVGFLSHSEFAQGSCVLFGDWVAHPMDGDAQKTLMHWPRTSVIVLADGGHDQEVSQALRDGATDFLVKPVDRQILLDAITDALRVHQNSEADEELRRGDAARLARLNVSERAVLDGLALGLSREAIAADLAISVLSLEIHRATVLLKLEASTSASAFRMALADLSKGSHLGMVLK